MNVYSKIVAVIPDERQYFCTKTSHSLQTVLVIWLVSIVIHR
jgi:hypothetical protein